MQFKDVLGQAQLKKDLIREVTANKVSHAQLFLGQYGYGTLPLALAFTQYIFCENKSETDSCGVCPPCLKNADFQHPDVHFSFPIILPIAKTTHHFFSDWRKQLKETAYFNINDWINVIDEKGRRPIIGTDESLEIIKKLTLKSFEGGKKVMIIWGASELNTAAANKLLKILEEPPKDTLFILISDSDELMLQTILSRTQLVKVPKISTEELSQFIKSNKDLNSGNADSIAARSEGDLIHAIEFSSQVGVDNVEKELFIELMRVCYKKDVIQMLNWADKMGAQSRENQKTFLKYALHMFRQSMLKNYTEDILLRVSDDESGFLKNFSKFISGNNIQDFMKTFNDGHYYIERNAHSKLLFTNICFQVMRYIHVA